MLSVPRSAVGRSLAEPEAPRRERLSALTSLMSGRTVSLRFTVRPSGRLVMPLDRVQDIFSTPAVTIEMAAAVVCLATLLLSASRD